LVYVRQLILILAKVSAIQVYGRAVAAEETGDLDAALQLYRTAFRRYDTVDRLWRAAEVQSLQKKFALKSDAMSHEPTTGAGTMVRDMAALSLDTQSAVPENSAVIQQAAHTASVTGILEKVLVNFPPVLEFEIDDSEVAKTRTATLNSIPDELLTKVLLYFSPRTIERFALVCRRARVVTLDTVIWKYGVSDPSCCALSLTNYATEPLRRPSTNRLR
jgi:F-box protein 9